METVKLGSRGSAVKILQHHLNLVEDAIFGKITEETVKAFQKAKGLNPDGIVGPKTWELILKLPPADHAISSPPGGNEGGLALAKTTRPISRIIIHCSATPEGKDFTVADITRWHKERGYATIGYHYVIYRDGRVFTGRDINKVGAHTSGYNTGSIGICYIGGLSSPSLEGRDGVGSPKDTRTDAQKQTMRALVKQLQEMYPRATVHGHNEFANKACPSFNVKKDL